MTASTEIDYVTRAPDGKEVEEITKKEIHKALRSRITAEQAKFELGMSTKESLRQDFSDLKELREPKKIEQRPEQRNDHREPRQEQRPERQEQRQEQRPPIIAPRPPQVNVARKMTDEEKNAFRGMIEDLIGTRGAYLLDQKLNILGKVPFSELATTLKNLNNIYAVVFDEAIDKPLVQIAERQNVVHVVGMESKVKPNETRCNLITINEL
jgi:DNA primase